MTSTRLILLLTLAATGCQLYGRPHEARIVEPMLPLSIGRDELVEYLNAKTEGLQSWRCVNTQVHAESPDLIFPQNLKGTLACSSPSHFRLVCSNTMGHADFGSNKNICWTYVKPGPSVVATWKHEDSSLLQYLPGGIPRLEPEWLMAILGVRPLDPDRYELQNAPLGSREVWLVAVEDAPDGTSLRRVIKVDTVRGVARLHALYDSDANPLLMAHLSDYKSSGKYELPHTIRIHFPTMDTELTLKFSRIETGCDIDDSLWQPDLGKNLDVVDLGEVARANIQLARQSGKPHGNNLNRSNLNRDGLQGKTALAAQSRSLPDGFRGLSSEISEFTGPDDVLVTGDERYFNDESPESMDDWETADELLNSDEKFARALQADSARPDFDCVAPPQPSAKRSRWFPFWKSRKD